MNWFTSNETLWPYFFLFSHCFCSVLQSTCSLSCLESNIAFLLDLSEEYQLLQLQKDCISFLHQADKSTENAIKFIPLFRRFGLKDLEEVCFNKIKSMPFTELLHNEDFQNSNDVTKLNIFLAKGQYLEGNMSDFR